MDMMSLQVVCLTVAQLASPADYSVPTKTTPAGPAAASVVSPSSLGEPTSYERPPVQTQSLDPPAATPATPAAATPGPRTRPPVKQPLVPVHSADAIELATEILKQAVAADSTEFEGRRVSLLDSLSALGVSQARSRAVSAYWRLSNTVGEVNFAADEVRFLSNVSPHFVFEQTMVEAAIGSARARHAQARVALIEAQESLAELAQLKGDMLPLPVDTPFVGTYRTRFASMFSGRPAPARLRGIDRALPHQLRLIERRAESVVANEKSLSELLAAYSQEHVPLSVLLSASKQLQRERREFLAAVLQYNRLIGDYAFATVGTSLPTETMVSTLIRTKVPRGSEVFRDNNVVPVARQAPVATAANPDRPFREVQPAFQPNPASEAAGDQRSILRR